MLQRKRQINLPSLRTETHLDWLNEARTATRYRLFVSTSGYETRSVYWHQQTAPHFPADDHVQYLVIGFQEFRDALSRPANDKYYSEIQVPVEIADAEKSNAFFGKVTKRIEKLVSIAQQEPVEVHVDYSCMPRLWYCGLPSIFLKTLRSIDRAYLWYTPGEYPDAEYPTAGIDDFKVFSGRPSLNARIRTHIFGLGFDRVRSQAIWSVLDPQNLVCFYADADVGDSKVSVGQLDNHAETVISHNASDTVKKVSNVARVKLDNRDVLASADHIFSVPIRDFIYAYGLIASIVSEFRNIGDVIIVPDGPKPLILASSLIPMRLGVPGVLCCHVTRRRGQNYMPVDVKPSGEPFGLSFCGQLKTTQAKSDRIC